MDMAPIYDQMDILIDSGEVEEDAIIGFESLSFEEHLTTDSVEFAWFYNGIVFAVASMIVEEEENDAENEHLEEDEEEG